MLNWKIRLSESDYLRTGNQAANCIVRRGVYVYEPIAAQITVQTFHSTHCPVNEPCYVSAKKAYSLAELT